MTVNLVLALAGALGVFLMLSGLFYPLRRSKEARGPEEGLAGIEQQLGAATEEEITVLKEMPLLDRMLGPVLRDLAALLGRDPERRADLAKKLHQAGMPYTVGDFYARKVILAMMFFAGGALFLAITGMTSLFFVPFLLGALGLYIPDRELSSKLEKRHRAMYAEMAFTLDWLALFLKSGIALTQAINHLAQRKGGVFTAGLRTVAMNIQLGVPTERAFRGLLDDLPYDPQLEKFVNLTRKKGPLAEALKAQGDMMRNRLEMEMLSKGLRSTLVITTIGGLFILPSLALLVLGPPLVLAFRIFGG